MQPFVIKKMAEVQAFANLSTEILNRSGEVFVEQAPKVASALKDINQDLKNKFANSSESEVFETKLAKTIDKLTTMMELYIGDEWDNPVEVLEWLSFYSGAAAAHAALVAGALEVTGSADKAVFIKLSDDFRKILDEVMSTLNGIGKKRVSAS
jgi:hypothetical protein